MAAHVGRGEERVETHPRALRAPAAAQVAAGAVRDDVVRDGVRDHHRHIRTAARCADPLLGEDPGQLGIGADELREVLPRVGQCGGVEVRVGEAAHHAGLGRAGEGRQAGLVEMRGRVHVVRGELPGYRVEQEGRVETAVDPARDLHEVGRRGARVGALEVQLRGVVGRELGGGRGRPAAL